MIKPILHFVTYTSEEAAEALGVSVATIRRAIKAGKLPAYKLGGKWFKIKGEDLLNFVGQPLPDKSENRSKLVQEFNDSIEKLYPLLTSQPGGSMSVFLHQAINLYTCDEDIKKINEDVKHMIKNLNKPEMMGRQ